MTPLKPVKYTKITFVVSREEHRRLKQEALNHDTTITSIIRGALGWKESASAVEFTRPAADAPAPRL